MVFPIAFQLTHQPNLSALAAKNRYSSTALREINEIQNRFFQSLLREPLILSLRYIYEPSAASNQRLQIFLVFNTEIKDFSEQEQLKYRLISALQSSDFYQIYPFQSIDLNSSQFQALQNLDWVNFLIEIKKAETISDKGYYLPRRFLANHEHDMVNICEQFSRVHHNIAPERFLLEITLQTYNNPSERSQWMNALDTLLKVTSKAANSAKDAILETVIKGVQNYQISYSHNPLFSYSLKLLAEKENNLSYFATTWIQNATTSNYTNQYQNLPVVGRGSSEFQQSLQATREVRVSPRSSPPSRYLQVWQQQFGSQDICQVFGSKPLLGNGSTSSSQLVPPPQPPVASYQPLPNTSQASSSLALGGSHALANSIATQGWQRSQLAKMMDFLPLQHLVTLDEFSSFLRVVVPKTKPIPGMAVAQTSFPKCTAEELFFSHKNLITKDKYIVGINEQGNVVSSDWNDAPHRLVAGVTRCGKTNFLHWLIFQFLYADPQRKVFILDLKQNNFRFYTTQLPKKISERVIIATEILKCGELLETVYAEYQRRQEIIGDYQTIQEMVDNGGQYVPRLLVLVDEAAMIPAKCREIKSTIPLIEQYKYPNLTDLQAKIDTYLQYFATTGAGFGIHLMYCTQNPRGDVITTQVTSQLEERLIFRITGDTSAGIIGEKLYSHGLKIQKGEEGKGIAYIDGVEGSQYVYTPLIAVPPATSFERTLWNIL
ncbi:FtsK/SpoIIIE domain-containing protein [Coleofasciculus sp. FACHB-SPT9]|uniref:FtsK/SpoIIIE domain-containing protein n=1 Tax=Cyanophyceae TaxID=3028117 RepID=UPI001683D84A|nr:FtsK/SpoIIIE domain-containing protein [Coleofasciculus sp. FACHB-SPT9]MBD1889491.1 hypothetical protein [Coleofasciculus sp. FACHB-SPT9]